MNYLYLRESVSTKQLNKYWNCSYVDNLINRRVFCFIKLDIKMYALSLKETHQEIAMSDFVIATNTAMMRDHQMKVIATLLASC